MFCESNAKVMQKVNEGNLELEDFVLFNGPSNLWGFLNLMSAYVRKQTMRLFYYSPPHKDSQSFRYIQQAALPEGPQKDISHNCSYAFHQVRSHSGVLPGTWFLFVSLSSS